MRERLMTCGRHISCTSVERVHGVGRYKEVNETVHNVVRVQNAGPVLAQANAHTASVV